MKKIILGLMCLLSAASTFAAGKGYDLKMKVSSNGKHIASPHIIVKQGETGSVTQGSNGKETFVEVIANEGSIQGHKGILMKFVVGAIDKDGRKTIIGTPEILAHENEEAKVTVGKNDGSDTLELSVLAQRKSL